MNPQQIQQIKEFAENNNTAELTARAEELAKETIRLHDETLRLRRFAMHALQNAISGQAGRNVLEAHADYLVEILKVREELKPR